MVKTTLDEDKTLPEIQSLSLSVPTHINSLKYKNYYTVLINILNLKDENSILRNGNEENTIKEDQEQKQESDHFVNGVYLTPNIWLCDSVTIDHVDIKTKIISNLNKTMENGTSSDELDLSEINENSLLYYSKLLAAYEFDNKSAESNELCVHSDELQGDESTESDSLKSDCVELEYAYKSKTSESYPAYELQSNVSSISSLPKRGSSSDKRDSRKISISSLTTNQDPTKDYSTNLVGERSFTKSDFHIRHSSFNNLISRSKIYNKIKKHRLSSASLFSANSSHSENIDGTSKQISPRNSILLGQTLSRKPSNFVSFPETAKVSNNQYSENEDNEGNRLNKNKIRKDKYNYYVQLLLLSKSMKKIIKLLNKSMDSFHLVKYLDFINENIIRFVIMDTMQMTKKYALYMSNQLR